jgi:hypothetical protein
MSRLLQGQSIPRRSAGRSPATSRRSTGRLQGRRPLLATFAAILVAVTAGCMTLEGGEPGPSVDAPGAPRPGTEHAYRITNGYNGEPRASGVRRFDAGGSRFEGLTYEEAGTGGFGRPIAMLVAQQFDAAGDLVAWERADGSRTTFDPPLRLLPFPLVPGQTIRQNVLARVDGEPRPRRVIMVARVGGWETVTVPAGRYRALRITRDLWLGDFEFHRTETRRIEIDWYSPDASAVVRSSEDSAHQDLMMGRGRFGEAVTRRGDWLVRELQPPIDGAPTISRATSRSP